MIKQSYIYCLLIAVMSSVNTYAQTVGIRDVTSIESKVLSYENNKIKIAQYKEELLGLDALRKDKVQRLKDELSALYKERDDLIADMKVGAKCSQCGKYKSEFEKEGKSFEQHLGEVKGYAIPATTAELEATRKMFTEKIALKKVQIQNLEKGDNAVIKKRNEISNLENQNDRLCIEITGHSKNYETAVLAEAKTKHDNWVSDLMSYTTTILIADDKITIYKARVIRYEQEFKKEREIIKERVKKENLETQNEKNAKIAINQQQIKEIQIEQTNYLSPLESNLNKLRTQKNETEKELMRLNIPDNAKAELTASLNQIVLQISTLEKNILDYNTNVKSKITSLENECKKLKDEVFQLSINLPKQQEVEIAKIKPIYDQKKLEANQSVTKSTNELVNARKLYSEKAEFYKRQNQLYADQVISESNRMVIAGQKISCPIWNEVRFKVITYWNQVFPCVNKLTTMAKPYSYNVFNTYCPDKSSASYMAAYKSFLISLDEVDKEAVRGNSNVFWFELITK
ncbi:hypothetical protein SGQ83_00535 [Flavobacterium sp. Fl-318]|uniref:Uncharacterized protein n=1 Tax=Flavobacterium cupriresistens TaxID=2893885 RepID=A0ABU4R5N8_9FLAO|nr:MULTISPECIES: hypothetical protein [unclassified Flavobacterium]MDX6187823.1 hypothetical protein [Flavobacterium sp. Fl-318]UFH42255.1 hypothetical protein LNP23_20915 [Flavobacterium sp. F-323]